MKKINKVCGIIALAFAIILSSVGIVLASVPTTYAYDVSFTGSSLLSTYTLGDDFFAPEAKVTVGQTELDCTKQVLVCPDGTAYSLSGKYVLESVGKYALRYYAQHNGKSVYAEKEFDVKGGLVSLSSMHSTVKYGTSGEDKGNHEGLVVSLASGDTFVYNKPINLTGKTDKDTLISLFATPESKGVSDVTEFTIRLTDAIDPTNYVEIIQWANPYDGNEAKGYALYAGVRAYNQKISGTACKGQPSEETIVGTDGNYYKVYKDIYTYQELGYPSYMASLAARDGYDYNPNKNFCSPFKYSFNYAELQIYSNPQEAGRVFGNNMMADFDDNQYFDQLWHGFTTGEVYLSIYSNNYNKAMFNFVIENIYDDDLSLVNYTHTDSPEIFLDIEEEATPYAILNQSYNIIPAKAYSSVDGIISCNVLVYEDYYGDRKAVSVVDGAFKPTKLDTTYHILYKATDSCGLESVLLREIKVKSQRTLEIIVGDSAEETLTGVNTLLKNVEYSGMNGDYTFEVFAKKGNVETLIEKNEAGKYVFWTLDAGDYEII